METKPAGEMFGVLERESLSMQIARRILALIGEKHLRPGDRLPPERELARMMQVSRPSLREALRALQIMNVIEIRQGSGNFVASLEPRKLIEHLEAVFTLDDSTYRELFQARKILEAGIAELAAANLSAEELEGLEGLVEQARERVDDAEEFMRLDLELHNRIARGARNGVLELFMASIDRLSLYSRRRTSEFPEIRRQTVRDHRAIVAALKARDPQKARAAMLRHIARVEKSLGGLDGQGRPPVA